MLKDMTREDWLEVLGIPSERIPKALLLRGTRNLQSAYARHLELFQDVLEVGSPNGLFEGTSVVSEAAELGDARRQGERAMLDLAFSVIEHVLV